MKIKRNLVSLGQFAPRSVHVGNLVNEMILRKGFLCVLLYSLINIILLPVHIHVSITWRMDNGPVRDRISIDVVLPYFKNNNKPRRRQ
jgi:hypothetical protein